MVNFINKHDRTGDQSALEEWLKEKLSELSIRIEEIQKEPEKRNFHSIARGFFIRFCESSYSKFNMKDFFSFLFYANEIGINYIKRDFFSENEIFIGKKNIKVNGRNKSIKEVQDLTIFILLSIILKDVRNKAFYSSLNIEALEPNEKEDSYYSKKSYFFYIKLFKAICEQDTLTILTEIDFLILFEKNEYSKKIISQQTSYYETDYLEDISTPYSSGYPPLFWEAEQIEYLKIPFLKVLKSVFEGDNASFNDYLLYVLEKHKEYFSTYSIIQGEPLADDPTGWISLPLIAACAIAHDKGMKREIESDYIPEWLVKGEFEGLKLVVE
jgi:hypothetical protein